MEEDPNILVGPPVTFQVPNCTLGQLFLMKLKTLPQNKVIQTEAETGRKMTTAEFLILSLQAAEGLKELGIQPGDVISLAAKNGIDLFAATAGTLYQRGIASPIDPTMKSFEFQHIFKTTQPRFVFCDFEVVGEIADALSQLGNEAPIVVFNASEEDEIPYFKFEEFLKMPDLTTYQPVPTADNNESIAFIVCSSGSTGLPKGVLLSDRTLLYQILMFAQVGEHSGLSRLPFLHTSHFFWISGILMYAGGVCAGLRRIIVRNVTEEKIFQAIQDYRPMWCLLAPAHLSNLLSHPNFKDHDLSSIITILTGGSALQKSTVLRLKEDWGPHITCTQAYGCTELGGVATFLKPGDDIASVGNLGPGFKLKVVDSNDGSILGPGESGELHIFSPTVMKGYVNNEEATVEALDEEGWIHTGDIGYYDEKGRIYINGRIKEFIKYQNLQIAPAELEQLIDSIPGVADVGVAGIAINPDTYYPMALVVKEEGSEVTEEDIMKCVNENMSEYKQLRGGVVFVDAIPRTPTGKIKRPELQRLAKALYMDD